MKKILLITTIIISLISLAAAASFSQNWEDKLFSMEFRDVDLKDVVRVFSKETRLNIIFNDEFNKKVTISFKRVALKNAFESLLRSQGLSYMEENGILIITKEDQSLKEDKLTTKVYHVEYQNIKDIGTILSKTISKEGSVVADEGTSSIIIKDYPKNHIKIKNLVKQLDTKIPQILIEARIIEVSRKYAEQFGIQWGGIFSYLGSKTALNTQGGLGGQSILPSVNTFFNRSTTLTVPNVGTGGSSTFANLPAATPTSALGLTLARMVGGWPFMLDLKLSAMEESGAGKILSSPSVLTLNNKEAKITAGSIFFVRSLATTGTSTTGTSSTSSAGASAGTSGTVTTGLNQIEATLELSVTPRVTQTNDIQLKIKTIKKDADFTKAIENIPAINTRSAETQLIVKDGETIVIGGIIQDTKSNTEERVPFLSKIPILGYLFKNNKKSDESAEMIIFITPRIVTKSEVSAN